MLEPDRSSHGIGLLPFGHPVLVEPDISGRLTLLEEQQIGPDGGVGTEHGIGQAHDGVEVTFLHQVFLETGLDALAEQRAVRQDHGSVSET